LIIKSEVIIKMKTKNYFINLTPEMQKDIKNHYLASYRRSDEELSNELGRYKIILTELIKQGDNLNECNRLCRNQVMILHQLTREIIEERSKGIEKLSKLNFRVKKC